MVCTEDEFNAVLPLIKSMSDERLEVVRDVMVNGASQQDIATSLGTSRAVINKSVSKVWRYVLEYRLNNDLSNSIPPGWARAVVIAPRAKLRKFKREMDKEFFDLINGSCSS
jgi:hypothetical protein